MVGVFYSLTAADMKGITTMEQAIRNEQVCKGTIVEVTRGFVESNVPVAAGVTARVVAVNEHDELWLNYPGCPESFPHVFKPFLCNLKVVAASQSLVADLGARIKASRKLVESPLDAWECDMGEGSDDESDPLTSDDGLEDAWGEEEKEGEETSIEERAPFQGAGKHLSDCIRESIEADIAESQAPTVVRYLPEQALTPISDRRFKYTGGRYMAYRRSPDLGCARSLAFERDRAAHSIAAMLISRLFFFRFMQGPWHGEGGVNEICRCKEDLVCTGEGGVAEIKQVQGEFSMATTHATKFVGLQWKCSTSTIIDIIRSHAIAAEFKQIK